MVLAFAGGWGSWLRVQPPVRLAASADRLAVPLDEASCIFEQF